MRERECSDYDLVFCLEYKFNIGVKIGIENVREGDLRIL